jgi:hypothetical protein
MTHVFRHPKFYRIPRDKSDQVMTHVFKHPKFYRIPRDKSDQVISKSSHDGESERAPGPGQSNKQQASHKLVTPRSDQKEATSLKQQASSNKRR